MKSETQTAVKNANLANTAALPGGGRLPRLGQGTWHMAEDPARRASEIEALKIGVELGMTLIDTAEMYADGRAESLVGEAIRGLPRNELFIVSKVYPHNAGRTRIYDACKSSLKRLGLESLDLYLLHWRGGVPLAETAACMNELVASGLIRRWGVSNFDTRDMQELWGTPGGSRCAVNQVLYHLGSRGAEYDLMPWMKERGIPLMAYCPIAQAGDLRRGLLSDPAVLTVAETYGITPVQVLLSFVLHKPDVIAIPKSGDPRHTSQNAMAGTIRLGKEDIHLLNSAFPAPIRKMPLHIE